MLQEIGLLPLCHAASIDDADGTKRADGLSPPQAGEFPRAPAACGDAQGSPLGDAGHGRLLLVPLSSTWTKMNPQKDSYTSQRHTFFGSSTSDRRTRPILNFTPPASAAKSG